MGRILAIDYGRKRCGLAVTDPLQIAANPLSTVRACDLEAFLKEYCAREKVDEILVGHPQTVRGEDSESMQWIRPFVGRLKRLMPEMRIVYYDERFTSVLAHKAMIDAGMKKSKRREKGNADMLAAVILLTDYLESARR